MESETRLSDAAQQLADLRVAIVHWYLVNRRGGERVLEVLCQMFPAADLYTLIADPAVLSPTLRKHRIFTSFVQHIPGCFRWYQHLLPLYPFALEQFDLSKYDLVISSEANPAKGVITPAHTCHVCYCHSPMRYLWDMYHKYRAEPGVGPCARLVFSVFAHYLRIWDLATASRVDYFVANSEHVAARIRKHYRREATVINPPVTISEGYLSENIGAYYLTVGQLVDYKRVDLAIDACNRLKRRLHVIGTGQQEKRLRQLAGPGVEFLGFVSDRELCEQYARCRALLFPGEEDFGLTPLEANVFGRPVIAYGRGGALETVLGFYPDFPSAPQESTGVFFSEQSAESLVEAIRAFESVEGRFSPTFIQAHAQRFSVARFKAAMTSFLAESLSQFRQKQGARPKVQIAC